LDRRNRNRRAAAVLTTGDLGVMINEEDHLRIQSLGSGLAIDQVYARLERLDSDLGGRLPIAFHPEFGYLTACPTNTGTGLRASVLMHLPGLVLTKEIAKVLQGLSQVGLTFRGLYGEGSEVVGNFFQLSNQTTLGKSEEELLDHLAKMVEQVIVWERQARDVLQREAATVIEDKVWRAYAWLRYARQLPFDETMNLLSGVRLGVGLNLISDVSVYTLNKLLIYTQPANLAYQEGLEVSDPELDVRRATYVRELLEEDAGRGLSHGGA
jgi:protein arginine kinase